jgi:hypothetical protein
MLIHHVDPVGIAPTSSYVPKALMKVVSEMDPVLMGHVRSTLALTVKAEIAGGEPPEAPPKRSRNSQPLSYTNFSIENLREQPTVLKQAGSLAGNGTSQSKTHALRVAQGFQPTTLNEHLQAPANLILAGHTLIARLELLLELSHGQRQLAMATVQILSKDGGWTLCATK